MPDLLAGSTVRALDTPPTVSDYEVGGFTFNATTYGIDADSGTYADCGVAFVAPTTGRSIVHFYGAFDNDTAGQFTIMSFVIREGSTVGSGTVFLAASDDRGLANFGTDAAQIGMSHLVTGLTAGSTYNVRLEHKVGAGIGNLARRHVIVAPAT